jgi:O-antigen/teichoic acid export membrane protein
MSEDPGMEGVEALPDFREIAADPKAAARATAVVLASRVVVAGLGWAGSVIVARSLSADDWGQFSFVFALLGVMSIVTDLGVGRVVLARLIDGDPDEIARTASSFIALRTVLGVAGYLLAVGYVVILRYPGQVVAATAIAGLVVVFATPSHALSVLYQSRHRLLLVAVAESLGQTLQLAITVVAAIYAPTLLVFVLPAVANEIFKLVTKGFGIRGRSLGLRPSRQVDVRRWGPMLREAIPLAIGLALTIAMMKIDVLMLSLMDTFDAVGLYSIGYKFSDIIDTFALAAAAPLSTLLVAAWPNELVVFKRRTRSAAMLFALAGAVCVAGFWPSAEPIIRLLYGDRFAPAAGATRLLVVGAALMSLTVLGIFLLTAAGKQRYYPGIALLGLALNVGLNLVLIPKMSYDGAAVSTVVTTAVTFVLLWLVIERFMPVKGLLPTRLLATLVLLTSAVAAVGQLAVDRWPTWWPAVSVVAVLAFVPFVYVVRMVGNAPESSDAGAVNP